MPEVLSEIDVEYYLLKRLLGVRANDRSAAQEGESRNRVTSLKQDEILMINVGSQSLAGKVVMVKKDSVRIEF